jgi:4-hydroxy-tetrahydrodipicolinate reductase
MTANQISIVLSGAPGRMAAEIAALALDPSYAERHLLAPFALSGNSRRGQRHELAPGYSPEMIAPEDLPAALDRHGLHRALVIDYSTPHVALENIRCFIGADVSFVMGTTGFDRNEAVTLVRQSSVNAVIAPNMAAPIVALQALLSSAADRFPGVLDGWKLAIRESHQATKRDVSGTARAIQPLLERLGAAPSDVIESVRDPERQLDLGVPPDALAGHGWHWYQMESPTGDAALDFSHRITGRRIYAEGTLLAAQFLAQRAQKEYGQVYNMIDVLEAPKRN